MLKKIEVSEFTQEALDKHIASVTIGLIAGVVTLAILNVMKASAEIATIEAISVDVIETD